MRALPLLLAFLICGCSRAPGERPVEKEKPLVNRDEPALFNISEVIFDRYWRLGYEKLGPQEQVFLCIWGLEGEVNNGGFDQYYFNSAGDHALATPAALEEIGAKHTAKLLRRGNALFGEAGPSPDRTVRQKQLVALGDANTKKMNEIEKEFMKYEDKLGQMLEAYVSKNAQVFRPK